MKSMRIVRDAATMMANGIVWGAMGAALAMGQVGTAGQSGGSGGAGVGQPQGQLVTTGQIQVDGRTTQYVIRHLPVSSFPQLPEAVAKALVERGCLIPQTYQAHRPENVVGASLERAGSSDWAVLCSAQGNVSLLVFFGSTVLGVGGAAQAQVLASAVETERLQLHGSVGGVLGFNWGIDPATPEHVHEAQAGMDKRPARIDHDALADTLVDHHTVYHFYTKGGWIVLEMPD